MLWVYRYVTTMLFRSSFLGSTHMSNTFITYRVACGIQKRNEALPGVNSFPEGSGQW